MLYAIFAIVYVKAAIRFPSLQNACEARLTAWEPKMGDWAGFVTLYAPNPYHNGFDIRL